MISTISTSVQKLKADRSAAEVAECWPQSVSMAFHEQRLIARSTNNTSSIFAERRRTICLQLHTKRARNGSNTAGRRSGQTVTQHFHAHVVQV